MAHENGEEPGSSQEIDSLMVQEVRSPDLLMENSALSKGGHCQEKKVFISLTAFIVIRPWASDQESIPHCACECRLSNKNQHASSSTWHPEKM